MAAHKGDLQINVEGLHGIRINQPFKLRIEAAKRFGDGDRQIVVDLLVEVKAEKEGHDDP